MKKGDKGNKVKNLQKKLNKIMSVALVVDGHFGQDTHLIVLRFQEQNNLTMDGIVGRVTMSAINNQYIQMMESSNLMTFGKNRFVVFVDAGHGGEDPGAIGKKRTREKDVVLRIARELKKTIDAEPGMQAVLTRDGDYYIPLRGRYEKARKARADLFVSIHADAFSKRSVQGSSVFVLSARGASSEFARLLADSENASDLVGGVTLSDKDDMLASVLLDLSQSATREASNKVAGDILGSLKRTGKTHKNHVGHANFMVLKSPDVPSVLVETGFISNPSEEKRLTEKEFQQRTARAITRGVRDYFYSSPPPGTWIAANRDGSKHIVARGDTLGGIADRYSIILNSFRSANKINGDVIHVGRELVIPTS